jgi:hypothetical protein
LKFRWLLNTSLKTVWEHKTIWLFGILISLLNGAFRINYTLDERQIMASIDRAELTLSRLSGLQLLAIVFLFTGIVLAIIFASFVLRGSVIDLVRTVNEGGEPRARHSLSVGIRKGLPMLGKSILLWVPFYLLIALIGYAIVVLFVGAFTGGQNPSNGTIALLVTVMTVTTALSITAGVIVAITNRFADRFIIIEGERVFAALGRAAAMLRRYLGFSFLAWLVMFGLTAAFLMVFGAYSVAVVALTIAVGHESTLLVLMGTMLAGLLILILAGLFEALGGSFWTYFFIFLRDGGAGGQQSEKITGRGTIRPVPNEEF